MTTLYIVVSAATLVGLLVLYMVRLLKKNALMKKELEDAKRYGEALKEAAEKIHKVRSAGVGAAADSLRERVRSKKR